MPFSLLNFFTNKEKKVFEKYLPKEAVVDHYKTKRKLSIEEKIIHSVLRMHWQINYYQKEYGKELNWPNQDEMKRCYYYMGILFSGLTFCSKSKIVKLQKLAKEFERAKTMKWINKELLSFLPDPGVLIKDEDK